MKYFNVYNRLLELMNKGVRYYSVTDVMDDGEFGEDDAVEEASRILEEHGIVTSCQNRTYAFVGGVELMREFIMNGKNKGHTTVPEVSTDGVSLDDIGDTTWTLVKKGPDLNARAYRRRRYGSMYDLLFDDDEDDDDDDVITNRATNISKTRERNEQWKNNHKCAIDYIEKKPGYDPTDNSFSSYVHISYPDGTPFVFQYVVKDGVPYITDHGLTKKYLESIAKGLPQYISERWVNYELTCLAESSALIHEDGIIYSNIESVDEEDDLDTEISYYVKSYENFFTMFHRKYRDVDLSVEDETAVKQEIDEFIVKTYNSDFSIEDKDVEDCALRILTSISALHLAIKRSHVVSAIDQLMELSKNQNEGKNFKIFERLHEIVERMTDLDFKILQKTVDRAF